ncbi:unnamed protein product [Sphagnum tenellum]
MSEIRVYEKFVELSGVVEIRYTSVDPMFFRPPEDLFAVQAQGIPASFCKKDRRTTEQALFYCKLCECDLKSIDTLRVHVKGLQHLQRSKRFLLTSTSQGHQNE